MDVFVNRSMRGWRHFAKNSGLSMPQLGILMQVYHGGSCNISNISERFETTNAAASQLAEKLVQAGYLERVEDPADRRTKVLTLSPTGREMIEKSMRERYRWVDALAGFLSPEEKQRVCDGMELMARAARELELVE
jgi:DNA-binding MarR family transcriptional regulator